MLSNSSLKFESYVQYNLGSRHASRADFFRGKLHFQCSFINFNSQLDSSKNSDITDKTGGCEESFVIFLVNHINNAGAKRFCEGPGHILINIESLYDKNIFQVKIKKRDLIFNNTVCFAFFPRDLRSVGGALFVRAWSFL